MCLDGRARTFSQVLLLVADTNHSEKGGPDNPSLFCLGVQLRAQRHLHFIFHLMYFARATDADVGPNAVLRYSLIGGNTQGHFVIDSLSGDVAVVQPLDFETVRSYRLVIRAQDGGNPSRSNTTQLLVNVRDVNDNAPRFYTSLFQESVIENVPVGHSIVRVQAYDADDADNAHITYRIVPLATVGQLPSASASDDDQLPFGIDPDTGWIVTVRELDREENHHHEFEVQSFPSFYSSSSGRNALKLPTV